MSYTVTVRGGEYKRSVFKMHLKLRGQQLKTITYVYILLYKNLKVTANQNSIANIEKGVSVLLTWFKIIFELYILKNRKE